MDNGWAECGVKCIIGSDLAYSIIGRMISVSI